MNTKPKLTIDTTMIRLRMSGDRQQVAIANAMLAFKIIETRQIATAGTDGIVMLFNPDFVASLDSHDQVIGLIVHELMHVRLNHNKRFKRSRFSNHQAANMAMDDEINPLVQEAGFELPPDGCWPHQHGSESGKSWESYYAARLAKLAEDTPESPESDESEKVDKPCDQAGNGDTGADTDADGSSESGDSSQISQKSPESPQNDESGGEAKSCDGSENGDEAASGDADGQTSDGCHPAGELASQFAPELINEETPEERAAANANAIDDATGDTELGEVIANQNGKQTKGGRGTVDRSGDEPVCLQPANGERWQDVVIETFRRRSNDSRVDWGRRSRRMQPNSAAYIPARRKINGLAIALVVDVSGSCSSWFGLWQELANELIEEVDNIERLEIVYHHHAHCFTDTWNKGEGDIELECDEVGGTCHIEALAEVESLDVDAIIQFTDCETTWPTEHPEQDCITVLPPQSYELCPFGVNIEAAIDR